MINNGSYDMAIPNVKPVDISRKSTGIRSIDGLRFYQVNDNGSPRLVAEVDFTAYPVRKLPALTLDSLPSYVVDDNGKPSKVTVKIDVTGKGGRSKTARYISGQLRLSHPDPPWSPTRRKKKNGSYPVFGRRGSSRSMTSSHSFDYYDPYSGW